MASGYHAGPDGTYAWRDIDGRRVEIPTEEFWSAVMWQPTPIFDQVLNDLGACLNCLTRDCACCIGCGGIDADLDPPGTHGYACVM
ncbi:hypothetical protein SEA_FEYRE_77 [Mycobacterium phage Feyre]